MIKINDKPVKVFKFHGGEVNPTLPQGLKAPMTVVAWLQTSDDIMSLILVMDALRRHYGNDVEVNLTVPYYPYARQDRVCNSGEALSKEVFFKLITSQCRTNFTTFDVHSDTDKVKSISMLEVLKGTDIIADDVVLVAPDLGATDKIKAVAEYYGLDWIQGGKARDPETGKLSGFTVDTRGLPVSNKHLLVLDDICDGGGTFIGLAEVLWETVKPKSMGLYVTHGIFSKGYVELLKMYHKIHTTNTVERKHAGVVNVIKVV